jgi:hypothetical protein
MNRIIKMEEEIPVQKLFRSLCPSQGRTIFVADAHCGDGKRFVVRADEKLTAFLELEFAICACRFFT